MKVFSKELWMESALKDLEDGILYQIDIDNALETWVNDLDGKEPQEGSNLDKWCIDA